LLGFEQGDGYVVDWDAGGGAAVGLAVVGVAVEDQVGAVAVYYFRPDLWFRNLGSAWIGVRSERAPAVAAPMRGRVVVLLSSA
jgi:hypothetical protein